MTTAMIEVHIGLLHANGYLVGEFFSGQSGITANYSILKL